MPPRGRQLGGGGWVCARGPSPLFEPAPACPTVSVYGRPHRFPPWEHLPVLAVPDSSFERLKPIS
jgi:hypothetical protein